MNAFVERGFNLTRTKVALADRFRKYVEESDIFEVFCAAQQYSLVTFRLRIFEPAGLNSNAINRAVKERLDKNFVEGYITPSVLAGVYFLRLVVCNPNTTEEHIDEFWSFLNVCARQIISEVNSGELVLPHHEEAAH